MIWLALAITAYSFYSLFSSESGTELALSLVRMAVAVILLAAVRTQNEMMLSAALLMNTTTVLVAMAILRKEVQVNHDER